ncbi:Tryp_alpha_amyl domain-containing protein [Cephalotus follicularis]|uniref:Tryp_alpha_amyl domain-containing protein n=1 Tax=Cephalotus follicularis TaxID=3775 RepID=A0A1Q3AY93_CEPFO|nr:Tryp_alpha_amyl domain-containing protein [Cephalotus follicularis]
MATSNNLSAIYLVLTLLSYSALAKNYTDCGSCMLPAPTPPPPKPAATPPPPKPATTPPPPKPATTPPPLKPVTTPPPSPPVAYCPRDTLKLGVCADLLGLVHVVVGTPASSSCCALIQGVADLEAALCLCIAIKADVLGINLNVPITLSLLLSACGKSVPAGFQCK